MSERLRIHIRQRRWWWTAWNPDESLATMDTPTYVRARTRERVIGKARRRFGPRPVTYEEVSLDEEGSP